MGAIGAFGSANSTRSMQIQMVVDFSEGRRTVQEVTKEFDFSDRVHLIAASVEEAIRTGRMPGFNSGDVARAGANLKLSFEQRPGPIEIKGMDVDRVVATSAKRQG